MQKRLVSLAAWSLLAAAACGTEPAPGPLLGRFGGRLSDGRDALLEATAAGVTLRFQCAVATFAAPIVADADGRFAVDGHLATTPLGTRPARLHGRAERDKVSVTFVGELDGDSTRTGTLRAGTEPDLAGPCAR